MKRGDKFCWNEPGSLVRVKPGEKPPTRARKSLTDLIPKGRVKGGRVTDLTAEALKAGIGAIGIIGTSPKPSGEIPKLSN
jgi:hypothetical protein